MAHQLYVLQVLTFNLLEERMMTKMDPNDQVKIVTTQNLLPLFNSTMSCNVVMLQIQCESKISYYQWYICACFCHCLFIVYFELQS